MHHHNFFFCFFGIWNIPFLFHHNYFLAYGNMEYSRKNASQHKKNIFGIWNIPGIFQKNRITTKMLEILEYGIFHGIFLEYSKKTITTLGGVKFNQGNYRTLNVNLSKLLWLYAYNFDWQYFSTDLKKLWKVLKIIQVAGCFLGNVCGNKEPNEVSIRF